jgi:hypothetical protein
MLPLHPEKFSPFLLRPTYEISSRPANKLPYTGRVSGLYIQPVAVVKEFAGLQDFHRAVGHERAHQWQSRPYFKEAYLYEVAQIRGRSFSGRLDGFWRVDDASDSRGRTISVVGESAVARREDGNRESFFDRERPQIVFAGSDRRKHDAVRARSKHASAGPR